MKRFIAFLLLVMLSCALFVGCDKGEESNSSDSSDANVSITVEEGKNYYATIDIIDYGVITVKLEPSQAPITVQNFIDLAQRGFYDGLTFHRIISGFMMQGGDPKGNGTGDSGKDIFGEFAINGHQNNISHKRGVISMARAVNDPNSASCQFFIVHDDRAASSLDGMYAAFGYVTEGIEVVDKVCSKAKPVDNNGTILKDQQPVIKSIKITVEG